MSETMNEIIVHSDTCDLNAQIAKVCKSRLFVTKVVLICTVRLAYERSKCDKQGAKKDYFSHG
ncbi:hypothetical protein TSAR_010173 [Trichomalopsis sarcophagae]|uniref:Uncharacterized protein n=1 Tax=Trichomalopsis sarcophagae TaxID=543379 RepID=A0A232ETL4_9HYME|nr:hypothetical protein TSAR_010173 [Trichomalopsis sarcophagae]